MFIRNTGICRWWTLRLATIATVGVAKWIVVWSDGTICLGRVLFRNPGINRISHGNWFFISLLHSSSFPSSFRLLASFVQCPNMKTGKEIEREGNTSLYPKLSCCLRFFCFYVCACVRACVHICFYEENLFIFLVTKQSHRTLPESILVKRILCLTWCTHALHTRSVTPWPLTLDSPTAGSSALVRCSGWFHWRSLSKGK